MQPVDHTSSHDAFEKSLKRRFSRVNTHEEILETSKKHSNDPSIAETTLQSSSSSDYRLENADTISQSAPEIRSDSLVMVDIARELDEALPKAEALQHASTSHDICYGVVILKASLSSVLAPGSKNVKMEVKTSQNKMLKFFDASTEQVGAASSPVLCELSERYQVSFEAFVSIPNTKRVSNAFTLRVGYSCETMEYHRRDIRIVVYGLLSASDEIAYFLSDRSIFLQHPTAAEHDPTTTYFNPQYLLGPSGLMPPIVDEDAPSQFGVSTVDRLSEKEKAEMFRIFESTPSPLIPLNVSPSYRLKTQLKDHQLSALAMMVERELGVLSEAKFPTLWNLQKSFDGTKRYHHVITGVVSETSDPGPILGGVLADEMGLGKTLPVLALMAGYADARDASTSKGGPRTTLVITPKSTIPEWESQIHKHMVPDSIDYIIYLGSNRHRLSESWDNRDIVLTTYDTLRSEHRSMGPLFGKAWARVILDEAHVIRNRLSQVFKAVSAIESPIRWCLTGTPIQNCLDDYAALLSFIRVPPFEDVENFRHYIAHPIKSRQEMGFDAMRKLVAATCLRRTKTMVLNKLGLPRKMEITVQLDLDEQTRAMYQFFISKASSVAQNTTGSANKASAQRSKGNMLVLINILRLICNHGISLLPEAAVHMWQERDASTLAWKTLADTATKCIFCSTNQDEVGGTHTKTRDLPCGHIVCSSCDILEDAATHCRRCIGNSARSVTDDRNALLINYSPSAKVKALLDNLKKGPGSEARHATVAPQKSVVFSYWTRMLDLIERALGQAGLIYTRIDGQKSLMDRKDALEKFRNDLNCTVMLATIGSAGEGIDLTAANSLHIMEPQWNPMIEAQAVDRVHRIGQSRDVSIRRYVIKDSIEDYVRWVQQDKLRLIHHSLSESTRDQVASDERWKKLLDSFK